MMRRLIVLCLLVLCIPLAQAQELDDTYTFVDDTRFSHPGDFLVYDFDYDEVFMSNQTTDIYVYTYFERSQILNDIDDDLQAALDVYFGDVADFEPGDADETLIGGRPAAVYNFTVEGEDGEKYERLVIAVLLESNGTIPILSAVPEEGDVITEKQLVLDIVASMRTVAEDLAANPQLGNLAVVDDEVVIEHGDEWQMGEAVVPWAVSLQSDAVQMDMATITPEEMQTLRLKNQVVDVLGHFFRPFDSTLGFDALGLDIAEINGKELLYYTFQDGRDGQALEHVFWLDTMTNGAMVVVNAYPLEGQTIRTLSTLQDMLGTMRLRDEAPRYSPPLDSAFRFDNGMTVRYSHRWFPEPAEDNLSLTLQGFDTNLLVVPYTPEEVADSGYSAELSDALLELVVPLDETVVLRPEDISTFLLPSGRPAVRTTYIETDEEGLSYERIVSATHLDDGSLVFMGAIPQPGLTRIVSADEAAMFAILDTVTAGN